MARIAAVGSPSNSMNSTLARFSRGDVPPVFAAMQPAEQFILAFKLRQWAANPTPSTFHARVRHGR